MQSWSGALIGLGIRFVSHQENIDSSSALGQAPFTVVSVVAELERNLIRERWPPGFGMRERTASRSLARRMSWTENGFWS
jgi:hypothetical protein